MKLLGSIVSNINRILTREMSQKTPLVLISCGSFNQITNLDRKLFKGLTNLNEILLEHNQISQIDLKAFRTRMANFLLSMPF